MEMGSESDHYYYRRLVNIMKCNQYNRLNTYDHDVIIIF